VSKAFDDNKVISFFVSSILFGLSHPLILGVNTKGLIGIPGFVGTFATGAVWWFTYHLTKSLRGNIITHTIINFAGMTAYMLANKAIITT
jgi:membrane protease YdiL (CAAX protease family)